MKKNNSLSQFFALVAVTGILMVVCTSCLGGCCGSTVPDKPQPSVSETEEYTSGSGGEVWTPEKNITIPEDGSLPNLVIPAGTKVTPKSAKGQQEIRAILPGEIETSLPEGKKIIAAVDITPPGQTFSPPVPVKFPLPSGHGYSDGDILEMMQFDEVNRNWLPAGEAEVKLRLGIAVGEIAHTTIFALVEPGGVQTAIPVAARVPVASLLDDLDSMLEIGDYAAMVVYFPEEIGGETVDALTAYTEEQGYGGEIFWGELPPGTDLSDTEIERSMRQAGENGSCVILSMDLSDPNNTYLVFVANTVRAEGGGPFIVFQMDTYTGEVTQLADID